MKYKKISIARRNKQEFYKATSKEDLIKYFEKREVLFSVGLSVLVIFLYVIVFMCLLLCINLVI